jgi:hypothetical protein
MINEMAENKRAGVVRESSSITFFSKVDNYPLYQKTNSSLSFEFEQLFFEFYMIDTTVKSANHYYEILYLDTVTTNR